MVWNHRVMRKETETEVVYQIHEVFYASAEDADRDFVMGWTQDGVAPLGETEKKLKKELKRMLDSFDKPVLDYETGRRTRKGPLKKEKENV